MSGSAVAITDECMRENLSKTKAYTVMILRKATKHDVPGADAIIWEHGRRNFELRSEGKLSIVCPINDGSDVAGIGIFNAAPEEVKRIYSEDPAVKAGILLFEIHPGLSFPGDSLPG